MERLNMELKINSWSDMTIELYQEMNNIQSESDLGVTINQISMMCDADPADIRKLPILEFRELTDKIAWSRKDPTHDLELKFEIDGKKYGMIPDLNFITTGEWADIEAWKDNTIENLHYICALIYRPITKEDGDEYDIEPHVNKGFMKRAELFRKRLTIDKVWGALLFFLNFVNQYIEIIADYLEDEAVETITKDMRTMIQHHMRNNNIPNLIKLGGSTIWSIKYPGKITPKWKIFGIPASKDSLTT